MTVDGTRGACSRRPELSRARRLAPVILPFVAASLLPTIAGAQDHDQCVRNAKSQAEVEACPPPEKAIEVRVQAKPPARSASDWEADDQAVAAAPHASGAEVLSVAPGVFVSDRSLPGRAPHLAMRGFDGTSGQDIEIFAGNIPLNQASHVRAPGYADMRLIMPEVVKAVRVSNGPYDPRQGDFAVAGSIHMDLGLERPGFWVKGGIGSFGTRRVFIAFAPDDDDLSESFAAFEADSTDGPGGARQGERASFVGQVGGGQERVQYRATVAIGSARFDFPGYLDQSYVEHGGDPYALRQPLGRDRTSQALVGADVIWTVGEGTMGLGAFAGKTKTSFHQNLTGYAMDQLAGGALGASDDSEMVNDAAMVGLTALYRHGVPMTSKRDSIEVGVSARVDSIDQSDTRLFEDGTKNTALVDATVDAMNISAYADFAIYPIKRVVVRGGPRLDSLSYAIEDRTKNAGLERTSQGFNLSNKVMADVAAGGGVHLVASYGDGFRSPQARDLAEGDRVPFVKVRSVEAGVRLKEQKLFQGSIVGFGSWLGNDRVFDATSRQSKEAPASVRAGAQLAMAVRAGFFGANLSGTYTYARFTGSDATFHEGDPVPYAPSMVLRSDMFIKGKLAKPFGKELTGRLGAGVEGIAGRSLPGGRIGKDLVCVDALAALEWRGVELSLTGTNLLNLRYYDSQYVYVSNFEKSEALPAPSEHVLVAAPTAVMLTARVYIQGFKSENRYW